MFLFRVVVSLAISFWVATVCLSAEAPWWNYQYAGSTPGDDSSRAFLGGMASDRACHAITWRLAFSTNLTASEKGRYRLQAQYRWQGKTDTNQIEDGPVVELEGDFEIVRGAKANKRAVVYRLAAPGNGKNLWLMRVGENILHFLNEDKTLRIGNAGWSYTLNRRGTFVVTPLSARSPEEADASLSTNFWREAARKAPEIHGYFEGRSPCQEIAKLLNVPKGDSCIKIKWQLILYQDAETKAPSTYALAGLAWRHPPKTGKWAVSKGTKENPDAVVYQLDPDNREGFLAFQNVDENILLFLGNERELLVGNEHFSYTLNRTGTK